MNTTLIIGGAHTDDRGILRFINGFDMTDVKRFYSITHPSRPSNPVMVQFFYKAGFIESWGRGTLKIRNFCLTQGLPAPTFELVCSTLQVTFKKATQKVNAGVGSEKSSEKIIRLMNYDSGVTIGQLAGQCGVSTRAIEKNISKLKELGFIKRIGPNKGGYD